MDIGLIITERAVFTKTCASQKISLKVARLLKKKKKEITFIRFYEVFVSSNLDV